MYTSAAFVRKSLDTTVSDSFFTINHLYAYALYIKNYIISPKYDDSFYTIVQKTCDNHLNVNIWWLLWYPKSVLRYAWIWIYLFSKHYDSDIVLNC